MVECGRDGKDLTKHFRDERDCGRGRGGAGLWGRVIEHLLYIVHGEYSPARFHGVAHKSTLLVDAMSRIPLFFPWPPLV